MLKLFLYSLLSSKHFDPKDIIIIEMIFIVSLWKTMVDETKKPVWGSHQLFNDHKFLPSLQNIPLQWDSATPCIVNISISPPS